MTLGGIGRSGAGGARAWLPATSRRSLPAVLALALAVRLVIFASAASRSPDGALFQNQPDSAEYITLARSLAGGHGFSTRSGAAYQPDFRRTPIYPLLLAPSFVLTSSLLPAVAMNLLVSVATIALAYALVARVASARAAAITGLLLALDLTSAVYANLLLTEVTFTALVLAGASLLVATPREAGVEARACPRPGWVASAGAGALFGVAALCRPIGLLLGAAVTPAIVIREWRASRRSLLRHVLALNATFLVVVSIWIARNLLTFGVASLSPIGAVNLYFHRAAYVQAYVEGVEVERVRGRWETEFEQRSSGWTESQKMDWLALEARRVIGGSPGAYLATYLAGVGRMFGPEREHVFAMLGIAAGGWHRLLLGISWLQLGLTYVLAAVGTARGLRSRCARGATVLAIGLVGYFIAVAGPEVYSRFRVPVMPLLAVLAGFAVLPRKV